MNAAEWLRSVARRSDDAALPAEAADALASFARDPAGLVVACRRLLAHHPAHGVLWWLAARVLCAAEPVGACREAARLLDADRTAERLAACLPLVDEDGVVAAVGWPAAIDAAVTERVDLPAVAIRVEGADPTPAVRRRRTERGVRVIDAWDALTLQVATLVVPAAALTVDRALVPVGTTELLDVCGRDAGALWLLGGVGRVLPARLFDAMHAAAGDALELTDLACFDRVAGPRGLERSDDAGTRPDCPVAPELLRSF